MRFLHYLKQTYPDVTHFYSPEYYINYNSFTLEPLESALVLLDVSESINRLNICCGRLTSWTQEIQLCLLVVNTSLEDSIRIERRSTLAQLLNQPSIINYLSCIPLIELVHLLQRNM
jgi:hypothetical protein